jgi:hypothetical protein
LGEHLALVRVTGVVGERALLTAVGENNEKTKNESGQALPTKKPVTALESSNVPSPRGGALERGTCGDARGRTVLRSTVCGRLGGGVVELHIFFFFIVFFIFVVVVVFFYFFNDLYGALFVVFLLLIFEVALEGERHEGLVKGAHSALH